MHQWCVCGEIDIMGESLSKLIINSLKTTIKTLCSDEANQATFNRIAEVDPEAGQRAHPCIASRLANSLDVVELQPKTTAVSDRYMPRRS